MSASWKVALGVFVVVLACGGIFWKMVVVPANTARQIAGGYHDPAAARAALRKNPDDAFAHITLAYAAERQGDRNTALKEWQDAARLDPKNGYTQMSLAVTLRAMRRTDEAKKVLSALAQTNHAEAVYAAKMLQKMK